MWSWWYKLRRKAKSIQVEVEKPTVKIYKRQERFESWQEAVAYLGKKVKINLVETPDHEGIMTGIDLDCDLKGNVKTAYISVSGTYGKWEYWKANPIE